MKVNHCRRAIATLSLLMLLGFGPIDWWTLITSFLFTQGGTVTQQTVPLDGSSKDGTTTPGAQPAAAEGDVQCPMCPGPRPRPRPIPPGT